MKARVVLESPFAGSTEQERARNMEYLRAAMRDCLLRGEAPFASHALYTQPGVLDDDVPDERALGIEAGLSFLEAVDRSVVYVDLGVSEGMRQGIARARALGLPVEERRLDAEVFERLTSKKGVSK